MKCPICNKEIASYNHDIYIHGGVISEEYATCQDDYHFYRYTFTHGHKTEQFNNKTLESYFNNWLEDEKEHERKRNKYIKKAISEILTKGVDSDG